MAYLGRTRMLVAVVVIVVIGSVVTAGAAKLITGKDIKDGSIAKKDLKSGLKNAIPVRIAASLPKNGFEASNNSVENTSDGVTFGPYADGGANGGSLCTDVLNGLSLSDVEHLAFEARYTSTSDTAGVGAPYLRIFTEGDAHDAIFSPNTQSPDPDIQEGPFHTWVATAGSWRYDDDGGFGPDVPFSQIVQNHGTEEISNLCISVGNSAGTNLSALLRTWEINSTDYAFGL